MRYPGLSVWVLHTITSILTGTEVKGDLTDRKGGSSVTTEAEVGVM